MRYLLSVVAALFLSAPAAHAIVVSDFVGSHATTPGVPAFGVNVDGVVQLAFDDGFPHASGALITDRHILTAAHNVDLDGDGTIDPFMTDHLLVYREFLTTATDGQAVFLVPEPSSMLLLMVGGLCLLHRKLHHSLLPKTENPT